MNPPQNINNHYDNQPKTEEMQVSPMCCCYYNFTEESFYKFINIWDIVFTIFSCFSANIASIIINILMLILVVICLVKYNQNDKYDSSVHKAYAIIRIVFVFLELIVVLIFGVLALIALLNISSHDHRFSTILISLIINLAILLPILLISIQWSFLLKNVINNQQAQDSNTTGFIPNTQNEPQGQGQGQDYPTMN